jgi:hypothetical protein
MNRTEPSGVMEAKALACKDLGSYDSKHCKHGRFKRGKHLLTLPQLPKVYLLQSNQRITRANVKAEPTAKQSVLKCPSCLVWRAGTYRADCKRRHEGRRSQIAERQSPSFEECALVVWVQPIDVEHLRQGGCHLG